MSSQMVMPSFSPSKEKTCCAGRGLEVTRFVEDVVGGQQHFVLLENDAAVRPEARRRSRRLAGWDVGARGVADQDGQRRFLRETGDLVAIAFEEAGAFEQIQREIAADAEFGKDGEIGAAVFGFAGHVENARGIAGEVADGGIELARAIFMGSP